MRTPFLTFALALVLALAVAAGAAANAPRPASARTAAAPVEQFHGTVTSSNRYGRWFDVRVTASSQVVRFHTARTTRWVSCDWSDLGRGHLVAVAARKTNGLWLAVAVRALHHPEIEH